MRSEVKTLMETLNKRNYDNDESHGPRLKPIQCRKCNSVLARDETVEEHLLNIHSVGCHICDKTLNSEQNLELHLRFDHKETGAEASCQICKFSFYSTM